MSVFFTIEYSAEEKFWEWDELCMFFLLMYSLLSKNNGIKSKQLLQMNIISDVKLKLPKK